MTESIRNAQVNSLNSLTPASAALGAFLHAMRSRTTPESVGLSSVGQRRVAGLRREEVAQLAGVGVAWYTWLEQGRRIGVSSEVLERLTEALSLSSAEREHLFILAHDRPPPNEGSKGGQVSEGSVALLGKFADAAYIANRRWDVLAWNDAASVLFQDLSCSRNQAPNMIRLLFTATALRALHANWESDARVTLEKFRMDFWQHRGDPSFEALVTEIQALSSEFRLWWSSPLIHPLGDGVKTFWSTDGMATEYHYSVLTFSENRNHRLVVFTPTKAE